MTNKFGGKCSQCKKRVEVGTGVLLKGSGKWMLYCFQHGKKRITLCSDPIPAKFSRRYSNADGYNFYS